MNYENLERTQTLIHITAGHGKAVHYAYKTEYRDLQTKEVVESRIYSLCGSEGAGGGSRLVQTGISGTTDRPVTCKRCLKSYGEPKQCQ